MSGYTPAQICQHWIRQCFWNFLDWSEVCNYLACCIVLGIEYQVCYCTVAEGIVKCSWLLFPSTGLIHTIVLHILTILWVWHTVLKRWRHNCHCNDMLIAMYYFPLRQMTWYSSAANIFITPIVYCRFTFVWQFWSIWRQAFSNTHKSRTFSSSSRQEYYLKTLTVS